MKAFSLLIFTILFNYNVSSDIKHDEIQVIGPGLKPDLIVMPARYFFIYFRGENYTGDEEVDEKDVEVKIKGEYKGRECRLWTNILNRKDSSFIIRYKLYEPCYNLIISIFYKSTPVSDSPYFTQGPVLHDECYCPEEIQTWFNNYECKKSYNQINYDLSQYDSFSMDDNYDKMVERFKNAHSTSACHYVVRDNQIYRNCYGQHVGFKMFMDALLLSLTRKVLLPDFEFMSNLGDWPLEKINDDLFPIFSWCGSRETADIVMPTYDITDAALENMGRVSLDMLSVQGNIEKRWEDKENKAFWRGRDSSTERLKLIEISRNNPDLINASLTNFFFFKDKEDIYGPKTKHVSFFKFFDYKYQICVDGTVASYRFPYLLAGDSLVFKQNSKYYEHFYIDLEPWVHYVPLKTDLSDLPDKIKWAQNNDEKSKQISKSGRKFAVDNLLPQNIFCYYTTLFNEWSKKLISNVKIRKGMELVVPNPTKDCNCHKIKKFKDEL